ncbi:hypothetical protein AAU61_23265 [Desulfocarbo indianensis]|nr:hypothetical protein AAU61_23265 [Desulfocarbo indianensis]
MNAPPAQAQAPSGIEIDDLDTAVDTRSWVRGVLQLRAADAFNGQPVCCNAVSGFEVVSHGLRPLFRQCEIGSRIARGIRMANDAEMTAQQ